MKTKPKRKPVKRVPWRRVIRIKPSIAYCGQPYIYEVLSIDVPRRGNYRLIVEEILE